MWVGKLLESLVVLAELAAGTNEQEWALDVLRLLVSAAKHAQAVVSYPTAAVAGLAGAQGAARVVGRAEGREATLDLRSRILALCPEFSAIDNDADAGSGWADVLKIDIKDADEDAH